MDNDSVLIPNYYYDVLLGQIQTIAELKITLVLITKTIGIDKDETTFTFDEFMEITGLSKASVSGGIQSGLARGTVLRRFVNNQYLYRINIPGFRPADMTPYLTSYPGTVYLIKGAEYYKIGKSRDLTKRLKLFHLTLPFPIEVIHTIETGDCSSLERDLHDLFSHKRVNGEWFTLSQEDVEMIKQIGSH